MNRNDLLRQAQKYLASNQIEEAVAEYLKLLTETPTDWVLMIQIADLYLKLNHTTLATRYLQKAAEQCYLEGFILKSIGLYKRLAKLNPEQIEFVLTLSDLYLKEGQKERAKVELLDSLGELSRSGQTSQTIRLLQKLIEVEPENLAYRQELARGLEQCGNTAEAVTSYLVLGEQWAANGFEQKSLKSFEEAFRLNPRNPSVLWKLLITYLENLAQPGAALKLEEFLKTHLNKNEIISVLVQMFCNEQYAERILDLIDDALLLVNFKEPLLLLKGELYLRRGRVDAAFSQYEMVMEGHEKKPSPYESGLPLLRKIARQDKAYYPALQRLIYVYSRKGDRPNAMAAYRSLVDAYIQNMMYLEAEECLQKLMEFEPNNQWHHEKMEFVKSLMEENHKEAPNGSWVEGVAPKMTLEECYNAESHFTTSDISELKNESESDLAQAES
ncbi:MAG TPA: hypothetical protein VFG11_11955 [Acidobacteriota bacterium]|nr:hypothetical protein [Acidobacteriota bacterium]